MLSVIMLNVIMLSVVSPNSGAWACIHKTSINHLTIILKGGGHN
jgi:hypothetical protein